MKILLKLFSLKLVASVLGLLYSILQVRYFGASRTIEIYFAAQSLVYLVTSLTQGGQLAEVFLPEYHKLNNIKPGFGYKGLNVVINRMFVFGSVLLLLVFLIAPHLVQLMVPGFSEADKDFTTLIFRILLPVLYLVLINSFFITVLNAEERFGRAEFIGFTNTVVNILVLVLLYPYIGLWALVVSFIAGKLIEFSFYSWQLYRNGFRFQRLWAIPEFNHGIFFKTMQSTFMYVGATQLYNVVLTASISFLPEGTYAIFKYVQNLSKKIKGLFIQPFTTIFFTKYSILVQKLSNVRHEFHKNFISLVNLNAVIIIGSMLLGDFIISLIWESKKFTEDDVRLAFWFLLFNVIAILITSIGGLYRKMAVAQDKAKQLYRYWTVSQLLTGLFSYLLIRYFQMTGLLFVIPLNGILLSSVSYWVYKKTKTSIKVQIINTNNIIVLFLVLLAVLIKFFLMNSIEKYGVLLGIITVLLLVGYPIWRVFKIYRD